MKQSDYHTIRAWLSELKREACRDGRYPENRRREWDFDARHEWMKPLGFKPFRSITYQERVPRIIALERVLDERAKLAAEVERLRKELNEAGVDDF